MWPKVLPWKRIQQYVRAYASFRGLNVDDTDSPISYSTRVELAKRTDDGWRLTLRKLEPSPDRKSATIRWWQEDFDALLVRANCLGEVAPAAANLNLAWRLRQAGKMRYHLLPPFH